MDGEAGPFDLSAEVEDDFIPAGHYAPELARAEKARLWPRIWHMACREEDIPRVGDFATYEIHNESILIVRAAEDRIVAFYNVCQHRGRRLRDEACGHLGGFYCRFHGWRYDLDGAVAQIPWESDWDGQPNFKRDKLSLKPVRAETWAGWVWVQMDPAQPSLKTFLADLPEHLDPFDMQKLRRRWEIVIHAEVNWKVVMEAFIEGYHGLATHNSGVRYGARQPGVPHGAHGMYFVEKSLPYEYLNAEGRWVSPQSPQEGMLAHARLSYRDLNAMILEPQLAATERLAAETPPDMAPEEIRANLWRLHQEEFARRGLEWPPGLTPEAVRRAGISWHIFPNIIVLPTPDGALWYRIRPDGDDPGRCLFEAWCFERAAPGSERPADRRVFQGLDAAREANAFLAEDFDNMIAVHKGMESRGWEGARVNPTQERLITHLHRMLNRYLSEG